MSVAAASFVCLLIIFLLNDTVNGSFIRFVCQYPNSDMCLVHHQQLNNFNRFNMEDYPSNYVSFDEDPSNLDNRLEAFEQPFRNSDALLRCINLGDDSCNNGSLPGSGKDDGYLNGNGNPGKRSPSKDIQIRQKFSQFDRLGNVRNI